MNFELLNCFVLELKQYVDRDRRTGRAVAKQPKAFALGLLPGKNKKGRCTFDYTV